MINIFWIPFEIFLSLDKDISHVLMLLAFDIDWLFLGCDDISKLTFLMFLVSEVTEETSYVHTIISKHFSRRF